MARTTQQIETDIDNNAIIKLKEYLKDYLVEQLNITVSDVDGELQKIFTAVNGLETIVQTIPKPQEPAATDPTTGNDGDLFFNTTDKWLKYYHNGTWHNLAQLSALVDLTPYAKTADVNAKFAPKSFDYSDVDSTFTKISLDLGGGNTGRGQNIAKPTSENAPTGTMIKLKLKDGNTQQTDLPIDADGFYYNGLPVWRTKGSDIANYSEIKAEINAGKIMVGIKQEDGSLVLEPWENTPFTDDTSWKTDKQDNLITEDVVITFNTGKTKTIKGIIALTGGNGAGLDINGGISK